MKMKKMIATLLVVMIVLGGISVPALAAAEKFTDVKFGAWYYTAVDYAVSEGLFSGTSSNTFSPGNAMTCGMFVRVLGNKANVDPDEYQFSSFSDVQAGTWYAPYVEWAAQNGIVTGTGNGRFSPNQSVTREQMAVILYNYAKYGGCDLTVRAGLLANSGEEPRPPTPSPSPEPTPDPDASQIIVSDEVREKLQDNLNPEKLLDYVLHGKNDDPTFAYDGTAATWDISLPTSPNVGKYFLGDWLDIPSDYNNTSAVANGFIQMLTRTASDRFYITADEETNCFCLYYHPAEATDSAQMREIKSLLRLPEAIKYDRNLCFEGAGWAGPMSWELYGAHGIAEKIEYYLTDMHQAIQYYLTEPEPGVFYLLYGE